MAARRIKTYTLAEMKDKYVGNIGSKERDQYEYELSMDVLGKMIKAARRERHLTLELPASRPQFGNRQLDS